MINKLRVVTRPLLVASFLLAAVRRSRNLVHDQRHMRYEHLPAAIPARGNHFRGDLRRAVLISPIRLWTAMRIKISGTYANSYTTAGGSSIFVSPVVTYTGSAATTGEDKITFDMLQNIFDNSPGSYLTVLTQRLCRCRSAQLLDPGQHNFRASHC